MIVRTVYSGIFTHIQALLTHMESYSKLCVTLAYTNVHIQKPGLFITRGILKSLSF